MVRHVRHRVLISFDEVQAAMPVDVFGQTAKRKGARVKNWWFPSLEQWKALRWSQEAGCPEDHLSLEDSKSLAMTVMGQPGSSWTSAQVLEHRSITSLAEVLCSMVRPFSPRLSFHSCGCRGRGRLSFHSRSCRGRGRLRKGLKGLRRRY